jgi:hypothetical protein
VNRRQAKKASAKWLKQRAARDAFREAKQAEVMAQDAANFDAYAATPNGSARLVAFHDAVIDADDTLQSVARAIRAEHYGEAMTLLRLGRESLAERITELKDLL